MTSLVRCALVALVVSVLGASPGSAQSFAEVIFPAASRAADTSLAVIQQRSPPFSQAYVGVAVTAITGGTPTVRSQLYFFNPATQACDTASLIHLGSAATTETVIIDGVGFTTVGVVNGVDGVTRTKLPSEFCVRLSTSGGTATSGLWIHWVPEP